ncbi:low affinity immunoglobulin gamma Fc region receptor II-b-like isoform X2 [Amphiprion ocellaris]|uniref:low affinity immunoglobulin gamma Fc region receptor II-b-like isoform X2 n=1 Tax=Amphiprion ocellaris TaxID=80972 RepID=UPI0024112E37|nr:low affinity immunoglobulin gamma Fc region receptor II-b-like isoform X2 [Amphiprion ocellaris]
MEATTLCFRLCEFSFLTFIQTLTVSHITRFMDNSLVLLVMLEFLLEIHIHKSDAVLLRVDPNRLQHFDYESLSFHCEGTEGSIKLKGTSNAEEFHPVCKIMKTSSSCTISKIYSTDSGEFWCESGAGERSNRVSITITAGSVILDSPAFPVFQGDNVTLRCQSRKTSTKQTADFYKDGVLIEGSRSEQMALHNVSKSDEGFYKCSIDGVGTSPESFLAVGVAANSVSIIFPTPHEETPSDEPESPLGLVLMLVPLMVLLPVAFIYCRKRRASSETPTAASNSDEAALGVSGGEAGDDVDGLTYAVVFTKKRRDKDAADAGDNLSRESNHSRKPATEDADDSSVQAVYSTLKETRRPESGLSGSTSALNPTAAESRIYKSKKSSILPSRRQQRSETPD